MILNLVEKNIKKVNADLEIIITDSIKNIKEKEILENLSFEAKDEAVVLLPESKKIFVGHEAKDYDSLAIAIATAVKKFTSTKFISAKIVVEKQNLKALTEGALLGAYTFDKYKSEKKEEKEKELIFCIEKLTKATKKIFEESIEIATAVNRTRDMVNTVPEDFYPETMANEARKIAKEANLSCTIHGEKYLEKNGMNAMLSVGRASRHESQLIHLTYKPKAAKKKVVLVGKGLTYDSGGLSLKPADFMTTMKSDKSGGCAILGVMSIISKLELPIEVHAVVGAVENMIGGDAYKPDDVLKAKNGTTIEVKNTDAEGRLVLADCLCYAQDEIKDIDYIFDYATLTGACVVGVGEYTSGIMGNNNELANEVVSCAHKAGEYATVLHFNRFLKKTIKSEVADICNIANTRYGGSITAGIFLEKFISKENKEKWVHHDIAGPAYVEKPWGYNPFGGSGTGVRMTLEFLKNIK